MQIKKIIIALVLFLVVVIVAAIIYSDQIRNNQKIEGLKVSPNFVQREIAQREFSYSYKEWKEAYVTDKGTNGPGQFRVKRPENQDDSVSEGIAYGMIFALHANDKETFDGLWQYAKSNFNQHGLMSWVVSQSGEVIDYNSATDADLDMAYSLIAANNKWGKYKNEALELIKNILEYDVEKDTDVLKPSDNWGGSDVTNPSYFSPAYFELFREFSGDKRWDKVAQKSREILAKTNTKEPILPDWVSAEGDKKDIGNENSRYYEAIRIPWRQAMGVLWYVNKDEIAKPAFKQLLLANSFFEKNQNMLNDTSFISAAVNASLSSKNEEYKKDLFSKLVESKNKGYYHDSLRLLTLLLFSNKMIH
jgi:endo-1,4-beta-D-glucanase Y